MANVSKGGRTAGTSAKAATAKAKQPRTAAPEPADTPDASASGDADRLRADLDENPADDGAVRYVGDTGHLFAVPPSIKTDRHGNVVGRDPGVYIDFGGYGITKPYYPERSAADREYVRRVDEWIASGPREVERYRIGKLEAEQPQPPFARWRNMSAAAIATTVSAHLGDDHEANVEYVREAARYEREVGDDRDDVLAALDALLATEAAGSDVFTAEVTLR